MMSLDIFKYTSMQVMQFKEKQRKFNEKWKIQSVHTYVGKCTNEIQAS
jgi:hypothetical protein